MFVLDVRTRADYRDTEEETVLDIMDAMHAMVPSECRTAARRARPVGLFISSSSKSGITARDCRLAAILCRTQSHGKRRQDLAQWEPLENIASDAMIKPCQRIILMVFSSCIRLAHIER